MRLDREQGDIILRTVHSLVGPQATVLLSGSRLDDDAKGGDIDLLVEVDAAVHASWLLADRIGAALRCSWRCAINASRPSRGRRGTFASPINGCSAPASRSDHAIRMATDVDLAERVDAFAVRFARLQDIVGAGLSPRCWKRCSSRRAGSAIDNLNRGFTGRKRSSPAG